MNLKNDKHFFRDKFHTKNLALKYFLVHQKAVILGKTKRELELKGVEGKLLLLFHLNISCQRLKDQIFQEFTRQKMTIIQIPTQQLLPLLMEILYNKIQLL